MSLDLTPFKKAIISFKLAIDEYNKDRDNLFVRDSVIQRFEYTYSLAVSIMKRYLKDEGEIEESSTFNNMIRTANRKELLLGNLENWDDYRLKRLATDCTYDEEIAKGIISVVDDFYKEVIFLYKELEKRNE